MQVLPPQVLSSAPPSPAAAEMNAPLPQAFGEMLLQVTDRALPPEPSRTEEMALPLEALTEEDTDAVEEVMEFCHVMEPSRIPDAPLPMPVLQPGSAPLPATDFTAMANERESPNPERTEALASLTAGVAVVPDQRVSPPSLNMKTAPEPEPFTPPSLSIDTQGTEPRDPPIPEVVTESSVPQPVSAAQLPEAARFIARDIAKESATPVTATPAITAPVQIKTVESLLRPVLEKPGSEAAFSNVLADSSPSAKLLKNIPEKPTLPQLERPDFIESVNASAIVPRDIAPETPEVREALFGALTQFFNTREGTAPSLPVTKDTLPGTLPEFPHMLQTRLSSLRWQPQSAELRASAKMDAFSARIRVYPPALGEILANIEVRDGVANVRFGTDNTEVRHFLESTTPELREAFSASRLVLDEVFVQSGLSQQQDQQGDTRQAPAQIPRFPIEDTAEAHGTPSRESALNSDALVDAWA